MSLFLWAQSRYVSPSNHCLQQCCIALTQSFCTIPSFHNNKKNKNIHYYAIAIFSQNKDFQKPLLGFLLASILQDLQCPVSIRHKISQPYSFLCPRLPGLLSFAAIHKSHLNTILKNIFSYFLLCFSQRFTTVPVQLL